MARGAHFTESAYVGRLLAAAFYAHLGILLLISKEGEHVYMRARLGGALERWFGRI